MDILSLPVEKAGPLLDIYIYIYIYIGVLFLLLFGGPKVGWSVLSWHPIFSNQAKETLRKEKRDQTPMASAS